MRLDSTFSGTAKTTAAIQIYEVNKYTVIFWTPGDDSSITCSTKSNIDQSFLFDDVLGGSTYNGLKALNTTVAYGYNVKNLFGGTGILNIDSFTLYPAEMYFIQEYDEKVTALVQASELTQVESDHLLKVPKGIQCKEYAGRMGDMPFFKNFQ